MYVPWSIGGGIIYDHPRLEDFRSQLSKPSTSRPLNDTPPKPSAHVSPTKSSLQESKTDSLHATSAGQSSAKQSSVDDVKSSEEKPAGSDDILDVLHSRIDQLAASDSEDDIFAGELSFSLLAEVSFLVCLCGCVCVCLFTSILGGPRPVSRDGWWNHGRNRDSESLLLAYL